MFLWGLSVLVGVECSCGSHLYLWELSVLVDLWEPRVLVGAECTCGS